MLPHTNPDFIFDQLHKSLTNHPYLSGSSTPNPHRGYQSSSMPKTASSQARAPTLMARSGLVQASCPTTTGRSSCEPEASLVPCFSTLVFAPSRVLSAYLPMPPAYSALLPCTQLDAYTQAHCAVRLWSCGLLRHTPFFTLNVSFDRSYSYERFPQIRRIEQRPESEFILFYCPICTSIPHMRPIKRRTG